MTYNRMEAKPIAGEPCRFCGDAEAPLVKTPCCQQWICCDTVFVSFRGGGRCQVEHERFSMCSGVWRILCMAQIEHKRISTYAMVANRTRTQERISSCSS